MLHRRWTPVQRNLLDAFNDAGSDLPPAWESDGELEEGEIWTPESHSGTHTTTVMECKGCKVVERRPVQHR